MKGIDGKIFMYETCIEGSKIELAAYHNLKNWNKIKEIHAENETYRLRLIQLRLQKKRILKIEKIIGHDN